MSTFLKNVGRPLVVEFLPELHDDYISVRAEITYRDFRTKRLTMLFRLAFPLVTLSLPPSDERARLSKIVEPLAMKYRNKILFGTVNIEIDNSMAEDLHLKSNHWPAFAIREPVRNLRFPLDDQRELLEQDLDKFVESFINGKLKPTIKSKLVPEMQKSPIIEVVALSYDEIVMNKDKVVFK
jgi:protein disulfide-isomerase A1